MRPRLDFHGQQAKGAYQPTDAQAQENVGGRNSHTRLEANARRRHRGEAQQVPAVAANGWTMDHPNGRGHDRFRTEALVRAGNHATYLIISPDPRRFAGILSHGKVCLASPLARRKLLYVL